MSSIVYHFDKKSGNKYAYESQSYRDPVTKKTKTKRTYLGRVHPETGDIMPKTELGKRNRQISTRAMEMLFEDARRRTQSLTEEVESLRKEISSLREQSKADNEFLQEIAAAVEKRQASAYGGSGGVT